jgi:hypothetical protein
MMEVDSAASVDQAPADLRALPGDQPTEPPVHPAPRPILTFIPRQTYRLRAGRWQLAGAGDDWQDGDDVDACGKPRDVK